MYPLNCTHICFFQLYPFKIPAILKINQSLIKIMNHNHKKFTDQKLFFLFKLKKKIHLNTFWFIFFHVSVDFLTLISDKMASRILL